MGKPSAPAPPDPRETSAAQTGTNVGTTIANNLMGQVNQNTPYGSLSYEQSGTHTYTDPYTGQSYDIPTFTSNTTLTPNAQATVDAQQGAQLNLAELAGDRSAFLRDYLPTTGAASDEIDSRLYEMGSQRLDPRFERARNDMQSRLANQGISAGSEAYSREMDQIGQQENDAYNQLMLQGRGQAASEVNMPINQITALLSGSQVTNPGVSMAQPQSIPITNNAGIINDNYSQQMGQYNANMNNRMSTIGLLGGLFGL